MPYLEYPQNTDDPLVRKYQELIERLIEAECTLRGVDPEEDHMAGNDVESYVTTCLITAVLDQQKFVDSAIYTLASGLWAYSQKQDVLGFMLMMVSRDLGTRSLKRMHGGMQQSATSATAA